MSLRDERRASGETGAARRARVLFVVPARGGSKGIPEKNLQVVGGLPLVAGACRVGRRAAERLGNGSRVICSTDDPAIAEVAAAWGGEVPGLRPARLAADETPTIDVLLHVLEEADGEFDQVVVLQPTSPFRTLEDVLAVSDLSSRTGCPVVTVVRETHPAAWSFLLSEDGHLVPGDDTEAPRRRQDREMRVRLNGAVYAAPPAVLRRRSGFLGPETLAIEMPPDRSVDVDSPADLEQARAMALSRSPRPVRAVPGSEASRTRCLVVAEAGVNHNGDLDLAMRLVDVAADAGADAIKFQSFKADRVVSRSAPMAEYQQRNTGQDIPMLEMIRRLELSPEHHRRLLDRCRQRGILFLSTPFDEASADLLDELAVPAFKLPSGEVTNPDLLRHVARKGKPVILSTGMSTLEEVACAVDTLEEEGCPSITLLQCVSNYPADPRDVNLRAMKTMEMAFGWPVGYSDHTLGNEVALAAVALGACLLEKHFTLDRGLPGPDHKASAEPAELAALVRGVRVVESAMGDGRKVPARSEENTASVARRSLVAARDIAKGELLASDAIVLRRPGTGLPALRRASLLGRRARRDVPTGTLLSEEMFE